MSLIFNEKGQALTVKKDNKERYVDYDKIGETNFQLWEVSLPILLYITQNLF